MTLPKITVVTPSYNQAQFLEQTIKSVLEQNYPNLEYIIMDGGSTDNSIEIIKKYEQNLAYWQSRPDGGQCQAINAGFRRSTGAILCWLNSDDVFLPGTLLTVVDYFIKHPEYQWVSGGGIIQYPELRLQKILSASIKRPYGLLEFWNYSRDDGSFLPQPSTFWRRDLWVSAGGHVREDKQYSMDYELWQRFNELTKVHLIDRVLSVTMFHESCKSHANARRQRQEAIDTAYEFARKKRIFLAWRFFIDYEVLHFRQLFYSLYKIAPRAVAWHLLLFPLGFFASWSRVGQARMWAYYRPIPYAPSKKK